MLNWAAWLNMHHQDPQWAQRVIKENCWEGLDFSNWDQLENWNSKANVKIINTTRLTLGEVTDRLISWIKQIER